MKAITISFDEPGKNTYTRLLDTFIESWKRNATIPLDVHRIPPPQARRRKDHNLQHVKLKKWIKEIEGDSILIDCDMLCLKCPSIGLKEVEHIGICEKEGQFPINGGVIFVKDTPKAKAFLQKWVEIDERMLHDTKFHKPYADVYAGQNQASLGWMLENGYKDTVTILPTIYNQCEPFTIEEDTRMLHIKGSLRRNVVRRHPAKNLEDQAELWKSYEPIAV